MPASFILDMRTALGAYGERVADRGVDRFTAQDAEGIRSAWSRGTASIMAAGIQSENARRGWAASTGKAADGAFGGEDGVPSILLDNPYAVQFLTAQGAELVVGIDEATRNTVREFVRRGMDEHMTVAQTARLLRSIIPLTQQQLAAVDHLVTSQLEAGISEEQVNKLAAGYSKRLLASRATAIARTETIRASAAGLQASWASAQGRGLVSANAMQRWIGGGGARTCDICSALIGVEVPLGGDFPGGHGRPPAHTSCRCTLGLVTA